MAIVETDSFNESHSTDYTESPGAERVTGYCIPKFKPTPFRVEMPIEEKTYSRADYYDQGDPTGGGMGRIPSIGEIAIAPTNAKIRRFIKIYFKYVVNGQRYDFSHADESAQELFEFSKNFDFATNQYLIKTYPIPNASSYLFTNGDSLFQKSYCLGFKGTVKVRVRVRGIIETNKYQAGTNLNWINLYGISDYQNAMLSTLDLIPGNVFSPVVNGEMQCFNQNGYKRTVLSMHYGHGNNLGSSFPCILLNHSNSATLESIPEKLDYEFEFEIANINETTDFTFLLNCKPTEIQAGNRFVCTENTAGLQLASMETTGDLARGQWAQVDILSISPV